MRAGRKTRPPGGMHRVRTRVHVWRTGARRGRDISTGWWEGGGARRGEHGIPCTPAAPRTHPATSRHTHPGQRPQAEEQRRNANMPP